MIESLRMVWNVAAFEYLRVVKLKDTILTVLLFALGALGFAWIKGESGKDPQATVGVLGTALSFPESERLPFRLSPSELDEQEVRDKVADGSLGPFLIVHDVDHVEFLVQDEAPEYYDELQAHIAEAQRSTKMRSSGLSASALEEIFQAGPPVELAIQAPKALRTRAKLRRLATYCLMAVVLGLFFGSTYLFTGITGEKQSHVTESVLSAIPVQTWIDGKCVGLALASAYGLFTMALSWWIATGIYGLFHEPMSLAIDVVAGSSVFWLLLFSGLGFLMWFAFFAAVAATIDDPNASSRGLFLFVPAMVTGMALIGLEDPDSLSYRLTALFPMTAPGAMPVRLIVGSPRLWEIVLSLSLMVGATHLFRRAAARIFAMAMLLRGKDLAWGDIARAFRGSSSTVHGKG